MHKEQRNANRGEGSNQSSFSMQMSVDACVGCRGVKRSAEGTEGCIGCRGVHRVLRVQRGAANHLSVCKWVQKGVRGAANPLSVCK